MFKPRSFAVVMTVSFVVTILVTSLTACQPGDEAGNANDAPDRPAAESSLDWRVSVHRGDDDLVSAGLGLEGLQESAPTLDEPTADPPAPEALRRLAVHSAWNALVAPGPAGGVGGLLESLEVVSGEEHAAFVKLPEARHPARLLLQVPEEFDPEAPCLVAAPASGSRGVYGALPMVAPWALPAGCAVVYTDKGAGTDYFDPADRSGVNLAGQRVGQGSEPLGFEPASDGEAPEGSLGMPHAHSGDHPEADWGRYVLVAVEHALARLGEVYETEFAPGQTRVIAAGLSNGGGAVLRAAEADSEGWLDAVVAVMPNITPPEAPHLFDYATLAALYQPCLLADLEATMALPLGNPMLAAAGQQRCASLETAGLLDEAEPDAARDLLEAAGFEPEALEQAAVNAALDLWRSVAVTYASAYLRREAGDMPCGFGISAEGASDQQRQRWWATHSGIAPGEGITLADGLSDGRDPALPGLICLRELATGDGEQAAALAEAVDATRASAALPEIPVLVIHGRNDGLIPAAFSSRPYLEQARAAGAHIAYWEAANVQHFDALLAAPGLAERLVPSMPLGWAGLEHIAGVLDGDHPLGADRQLDTRPAPQGQPLEWRNLGLD